MPNILTHALMANDVLQDFEAIKLKEIILKYPQVFSMATSGPDFLFYYKALPMQDAALGKPIYDLGNKVHSKNINAFYQNAINIIKSSEDNEILIAYLAGHLMHWSLDVKAHPFVFNRSGEIGGKTKYWHYRFESMIDTIMVQQIKGYRLDATRTYDCVQSKAEDRERLASFYREIVSRTHQEDVSTDIYAESMESMYTLAKWLFDPYTLKFPVIQAIENRMKLNWKYSSHMVIGDVDTKHDILNLKHKPWMHPVSGDVSDKSFLDLYHEAILLGQAVLYRLNDILHDDKQTTLDDLIRDRSYDTGMKDAGAMRFYASVYEYGNL